MVDNTQESNNTLTDEAAQASAATNTAKLGDGVTVDLSRELPEYSNAFVKAHPAKVEGRDVFACICDPRYTPRYNMARSYRDITNPALPMLLAHGSLIMPNGNPGNYAFIYENNLGKRLYGPDDIIAKSMKAERVLEQIAIPIINVLRDFRARDLVHGNIRCDNLFDGGRQNMEIIKLGDCLTMPPSMAQPIVYESIERSMADPIARGRGTLEDDLYSLGVVLAMHMRSYDPLKGKTDNEIVAAKVVNGSYAAIVGANDRFSGGILELLRGLLIDDKKQRWNIDEVGAWLDGRRLTPKQPTKKKKSARAITLGDVSYYYATTLAHNIVQKPQEAVHMIENNELGHWVERSLGDEDMAHRLEEANRGAAEAGTGTGHWDRLLSRVSIALDPYAPLRYKGMSFTIEGLGNLLAESFVQKRGLSKFTSFFNENILNFWISVGANMGMDMSGYSGIIDKCRAFLRQNGLQYGIERCLYFLNDSVHCLSPIVEQYFARSPEDYLDALDKYAQKHAGALPPQIIDKHAACFLVCKDSRLVEPYSYDLSSSEPFRYILGTTQVLAAIQKFNNGGSAPHVTKWLVGLMDPVIERFHNIERQKKIRAELNAVQNSGNIQDIINIVENPDRIRDDQLDFRKAYRDYRTLDLELKQLEFKLKHPRSHADKSGQEWAATISGVVSGLIILGFIMVQFGNTGL